MLKNPPANTGDAGSASGLGRSPGEGNPLRHSCLENPHGWRSLAGYSPWGCRELDTTDLLTTHTCIQKQWYSQGKGRDFLKHHF